MRIGGVSRSSSFQWRMWSLLALEHVHLKIVVGVLADDHALIHLPAGSIIIGPRSSGSTGEATASPASLEISTPRRPGIAPEARGAELAGS
jgi:hypothetical protein